MTNGTIPARPRVLLKAIGCRLNEAELEAWADSFRDRGFEIAGDDQSADLVVVNTCAVTQEAARKSRQWLRHAQRANPAARLVVSGCLVSLEAAALAREHGADLLVDNQDKDRLVEIAADALDLPLPLSPVAIGDRGGSASPLFARGRQRAFIKVQDGCRYACTFCVTTRARGPERSRPLPEIIAAINRLVGEGIREVSLTGVHLGGYGDDLGLDLVELVRAVLAQTQVPRLRLGSLEPWDLPDGFWGLFADARLLPHLHLPMQSGCDAVLRRMARRCKSAEFACLAERGRATVPGLNLTTDIIAGFPGETAAEWQETMAFVALVGFGQVHCFGYSPRPGTRAASLPGPVDTVTKRQRVSELKALAQCLRHGVLQTEVGRHAQVLREETPRTGRLSDLFGYSSNYLPVFVDPHPGAAAVGEILNVTIRGIEPDGTALRGHLTGPAFEQVASDS
ncbi:MAG TPA: MiaB/RimO family radical SAM methylthiotransferase [Lamprocystis sp. (in: g-proteobacteria)]|nr:MiaB/RimO family radical SAM methylthiotransferase [Lamprocystis sp. (in: g-proteobacteria)]